MSAPTEHHRALHRMIGEFEISETLAPSPWMPQGGSATARSHTRLDCGGLFVVAEYEQFDGETTNFSGHGVYGYDAAEDCYSMYWFDSMTPRGFVTPAKGRLEGDTLTFVRHGDGHHGRYTYRFDDEGYTFRLEQSDDGETWTVMMDSVYRRRG